MGVPSFYRWLVEKYPNIVTPAVEEDDCHAGGGAAVYFDNLYLDMTGIITCFHPEGQTACPPPATFEDVFRSMFDYMDLLLRIVRPRRLLYLAVDGVAPRAKMNQQRARRFKSAKAAKEAELEENLMRERFRAQGKEVLPRTMQQDVLRQSQQPDICVPVTDKSSTVQGLPKVKCRGWFPRVTDSRSKGKLPKKPYQFLNIWVLREYLELEMTMPGCKHDIERLIDDFIFISFLMGNDFIPHIPSLEIHEYAVDLLIDMYKTTFHKMGGYIVDTDKKLLLKIQRQAAGDEWNERNCDVVVAENTLELRRNLNDNLRSPEVFRRIVLVLRYYFSDVPSWSWYYPFYYAPFTSDLKRLSQFKISFTVDKPLLPSCALPKCYSKLMCCEESTIQMFYPSDLEIDTHGKRFLWQGVAKLPFIDVNLLLSATKTVEKDLALHETRRNTIRQEKILLRNSNSLANDAAFVPISEKKLLIWTRLLGCPMLIYNLSYDGSDRRCFFNPEAVKPVSRLLDNVIVPDKTVIESDVRTRPMWHTYPAPRPPTVTCRPHTLWKGSSTAMQQREEVKNAGTGWMGRGGGGVGATAADTRQIGRSGFGRGRGDAAGGAETLHRMSGSYVHRERFQRRPVGWRQRR
ncbi:hypothetical protein ZWY2020_036032 [Hordeum vulgare]|nr:hypothetical protein ZWY2020_036032 [Hordeum vulgare]